MKPLLLLKTGELSTADQFGPYEHLFSAALNNAPLTVVDVRAADPPHDDWAGVIITGSPASTYDGSPWIARAEAFLRRTAERKVPLFGVCFGHQLLAQTFGGRVEKCRDGFEIGTTTITLTAAGREDPLFRDSPATFAVQMSHGDVVVELPPGAVSLGENSHAPRQAFRMGDRIWGVQFHPEFTPPVVAALIRAHFDRPQVTREASERRESLLAAVREAPEAPHSLLNFLARVRRAL